MANTPNMSAGPDGGKVVQMSISDGFSEGQEVYLNEQYYVDFNTSVLEIPKYGWRLKTLAAGVATIEYQRRNLKLLMSLMLETKYLKKEM